VRTLFPFGIRVDSHRNPETGMFIAKFGEVLECASTETQAVSRLLDVLEMVGDHIRESRKRQEAEVAEKP
jgi:hypothetical protein